MRKAVLHVARGAHELERIRRLRGGRVGLRRHAFRVSAHFMEFRCAGGVQSLVAHTAVVNNSYSCGISPYCEIFFHPCFRAVFLDYFVWCTPLVTAPEFWYYRIIYSMLFSYFLCQADNACLCV